MWREGDACLVGYEKIPGKVLHVKVKYMLVMFVDAGVKHYVEYDKHTSSYRKISGRKTSSTKYSRVYHLDWEETREAVIRLRDIAYKIVHLCEERIAYNVDLQHVKNLVDTAEGVRASLKQGVTPKNKSPK